MVNFLGSLDVDLILDEGPDTINMMADTLDRLQGIPNIPLPILIELMPISYTLKKKLLAMLNQGPSEEQKAAQQLELQGAAAKVKETESKAVLNQASAQEKMRPEMPAVQGQPQQQEYELPPELQDAQAIADINETNASAQQKLAAARKAITDAALAPAKAEHEASLARANFHQGVAHGQALNRRIGTPDVTRRFVLATHGEKGLTKWKRKSISPEISARVALLRPRFTLSRRLFRNLSYRKRPSRKLRTVAVCRYPNFCLSVENGKSCSVNSTS
jgi:hypothetical protein